MMRDIKVEAIRCVTAIIATAIVAAASVLVFSVEVIPFQYGGNKSVVIVDKIGRTAKSCEEHSIVMICGPSAHIGD